MKMTPGLRRKIKIQNRLFTLLLFIVSALIAWLSTQYAVESDWTASQRNSLSDSSTAVLVQMPEAIHITAFVRENKLLRDQISNIISRYQRSRKNISLQFVNPDAEPDRIRELGITHEGELLIAYQGRSEKVNRLTEQSISNALLQIARKDQKSVLFLGGHGERTTDSEANYSLGNFGKALEQKGIMPETLNLAASPAIPASTHLLVIASPQTSLLTGEVDIILSYAKGGGNLLWLTEPGETGGLERLADFLSIEFLPGTIVDASTQLFGIDNPAFVLIPEYPSHPITAQLDSLTLFPEAVALQATDSDWQTKTLLSTLARAWTELGAIDSSINYDQNSDEQAGPLIIGYALERESENATNQQQRIVIIGDGDFLANSYLGNGGNLDLGLHIIDWLNRDDNLINIPARISSDTQLEMSKITQMLIAFGFLFGLPLLLLTAGSIVWWKRRRL
ncbi:MAG: Gldg family protein [Gammaproteobacteria bacterium]